MKCKNKSIWGTPTIDGKVEFIDISPEPMSAIFRAVKQLERLGYKVSISIQYD